jgi:hypothetical protein
MSAAQKAAEKAITKAKIAISQKIRYGEAKMKEFFAEMKKLLSLP